MSFASSTSMPLGLMTFVPLGRADLEAGRRRGEADDQRVGLHRQAARQWVVAPAVAAIRLMASALASSAGTSFFTVVLPSRVG